MTFVGYTLYKYQKDVIFIGKNEERFELISDEILKQLKSIPTQTLIDGLWVKGWPTSYVVGALPLQEGQNMAGRAVTLRFVPHRPDLAEDKPKGVDSAEYVAYEL